MILFCVKIISMIASKQSVFICNFDIWKFTGSFANNGGKIF